MPTQTVSKSDELVLVELYSRQPQAIASCDTLMNQSTASLHFFQTPTLGNTFQWRSAESTAHLSGFFVICYFSTVLDTWTQFSSLCPTVELWSSLSSPNLTVSPAVARAGHDFNVTLDVYGARTATDTMTVLAASNYTGESCNVLLGEGFGGENMSSSVAVQTLTATNISQLTFIFQVAEASAYVICVSLFPYENGFQNAGVVTVAGSVDAAMLVRNFSRQRHSAIFEISGFGIDPLLDEFFVTNGSTCDEEQNRLVPIAFGTAEPGSTNSSATAVVSVDLILPYESLLCFRSHLAPQISEQALSFFTEPLVPPTFSPNAQVTSVAWAVGGDIVIEVEGESTVENGFDELYLLPSLNAECSILLLMPEVGIKMRAVQNVLPEGRAVNGTAIFATRNIFASGAYSLCFRTNYSYRGFSQIGNSSGVLVQSSFFSVENNSDLTFSFGSVILLRPNALGLITSKAAITLSATGEACRASALNVSEAWDVQLTMSTPSGKPVEVIASARGLYAVCWTTYSTAVLRSPEILSIVPISPNGLSVKLLRSMLSTEVSLVGGLGVNLTDVTFPDRVIVCPQELRSNAFHKGNATVVASSSTSIAVIPLSLDPIDLCFSPGVPFDAKPNFLGSLSVLPGVRNMTAFPAFLQRGGTSTIVVQGIGFTLSDMLESCSNSSEQIFTVSPVFLSSSQSIWNVTVSGFSGQLQLCYIFSSNSSNETSGSPSIVLPVDPNPALTSFSPSDFYAGAQSIITIFDGGSFVGGIRSMQLSDSDSCNNSFATGRVNFSKSARSVSLQFIAPRRGQFKVCLVTVSNSTFVAGVVSIHPFISSAKPDVNNVYTDVPFHVQFQGGDIGRVSSDSMYLVSSSTTCDSPDRIVGILKSNNSVVGIATVEFTLALSGLYKACTSLDESSLGNGFVNRTVNASFAVLSTLVYNEVQRLLVLQGPSLLSNPFSTMFVFYFSLRSSPDAVLMLGTTDADNVRTQIIEGSTNPYAFAPFVPYGLVQFTCDVIVGSKLVRTHHLVYSAPSNTTVCTTLPKSSDALQKIAWVPSSQAWMFASSIILLYNYDVVGCFADDNAASPVALRDYNLNLIGANGALVTDPLFVFLTLSEILRQTPPIEFATVDAANNLLMQSELTLSQVANITKGHALAHVVIVNAVQGVLAANVNNTAISNKTQSVAVAMYRRLQLISSKLCASSVMRGTNGSLQLSFGDTGVTTTTDGKLSGALVNPSLNITTVVKSTDASCISAAPLLHNTLPQGTAHATQRRQQFAQAATPLDRNFNFPVFSVVSSAFVQRAVFSYSIPADSIPAPDASLLSPTTVVPTALIFQFVFNGDGASGFWVPLDTASVTTSENALIIDVTASASANQVTSGGHAALIISGIFELRRVGQPDHAKDWYLVGWTSLLIVTQLGVAWRSRSHHRKNPSKIAPPTTRQVVAHEPHADFEEIVFDSDSEHSTAKDATSEGSKLSKQRRNSRSPLGESEKPARRVPPHESVASVPIRKEQRPFQPSPRWSWIVALGRNPTESAYDSTFSFTTTWLATLLSVVLLEHFPTYPVTQGSELSTLQNSVISGTQAAVLVAPLVGVCKSASTASFSLLISAAISVVVGGLVSGTSGGFWNISVNRLVVFVAGTGIVTWITLFVVRWLFASFSVCGEHLPLRFITLRAPRRALRGAAIVCNVLLGLTAAAGIIFIALVPGTPISWRIHFDHFQAIATGLIVDAMLDLLASSVTSRLDELVYAKRQQYKLKTKATTQKVLPPTSAVPKNNVKNMGKMKGQEDFEAFGFASDDQSSVREIDTDTLADDMFVLEFLSDDDRSKTPSASKTSREANRISMHDPFGNELPVFEQKSYVDRRSKAFVVVDEVLSDMGDEDQFEPLQSPRAGSVTTNVSKSPFHVAEMSSDDEWQFVNSDHIVEPIAPVLAFAPDPPPARTQKVLQGRKMRYEDKPPQRSISLAAIATEVLRNATRASTTEQILYHKFRLGAKSFRPATRPFAPDLDLPAEPLELPHSQFEVTAPYGGDVADPSPSPARPRPTQDSFIIDVEMQETVEGSGTADDGDSRRSSTSTLQQPSSHAFSGAPTLSRRNLRAAGLDVEARQNPFQFDFSSIRRV